MRARWWDLPGAWRAAGFHPLRRPRWQWVLALPVSLWTLAWIAGQFSVSGSRFSPLDVPKILLSRVSGAAVRGLDAASAWLREPDHQPVLAGAACAAGLLWAATTQRAQLPALLGWVALMVAAEGLGYQPAVYRAVLTLLAFVTVLALFALPNRHKPVDRRPRLLPKDVLAAGAVAAAQSAVVPLLAPGLAGLRLLRPYLTRPPRPDPAGVRIPAARTPWSPPHNGMDAEKTAGNEVRPPPIPPSWSKPGS